MKEEPFNPKTAEETTVVLRDTLRHLSHLLDSFPHARLVEALDDGNTNSTVAKALERRQHWAKVFGEVADDLEKQWNYLEKHKHEAIECIALAKRGIEVFNGEEFKKSLENLNQFVDLCIKLGAVKESGLLDKVALLLRP